MRAAIYARVSSEMQLDTFSLDAQRRVCRQFCEARGYSIVAEYTDEAISGTTTNRPAFAEMLAAAQSKAFDVIVCHSLSRFSRSVTDVLLTLKDLEARGVGFASATEQFDFTTPIGRVFLTLLAAFAQWYIDNLRAETTRGKLERVHQGKTNARVPPLGYSLRDGEPVPDENAAHVAEAFTRYAGGNMTVLQVAEFLTERAGRVVGVDSAAAILRNPFYAGFVTYRGMTQGKRNSKRAQRVLPGAHQPIITPEVFEAAKRVRQNRTHSGGVPQSKRVYLLGAQLARCASCGRPLRAKAIKDRGDALAYRCTARERGLECSASQGPVRERFLIEDIERIIDALAVPADVRAATLDMMSEDGDAETIEAERRALTAERERTVTAFRKGLIDEATLDRETERIANALALLAPVVARTREQTAIDLDSMMGLWHRADAAQRAELLHLLLEAVVVDTDQKRIAAIVPHADFAAIFEASARLRYLEGGRDGRGIIRRGLRWYVLPVDPAPRMPTRNSKRRGRGVAR